MWTLCCQSKSDSVTTELQSSSLKDAQHPKIGFNIVQSFDDIAGLALFTQRKHKGDILSEGSPERQKI